MLAPASEICSCGAKRYDSRSSRLHGAVSHGGPENCGSVLAPAPADLSHSGPCNSLMSSPGGVARFPSSHTGQSQFLAAAGHGGHSHPRRRGRHSRHAGHPGARSIMAGRTAAVAAPSRPRLSEDGSGASTTSRRPGSAARTGTPKNPGRRDRRHQDIPGFSRQPEGRVHDAELDGALHSGLGGCQTRGRPHRA